MKKALFYAIFAAILFVTLEPMGKLIANDISPNAITFWRFLIGSLILTPPAILKIKRDKIQITWKDLALTASLGILFICISMTSLQYAVKIADAPSLIAIIFSANSVFTILFAMIISKEKMTRYKFIALVLGIIGVILCADLSSGTNLTSVGLTVFSALTFSFYSALCQKYMKKISGIIQSAIIFLTGSLVLLVFLLITGSDITPEVNLKSISILVYLGLVVTGIGYVGYFKAIEKGGALAGAMVFFAKPILTPFVTLIINNVVPSTGTFLAIICIVIASYFAMKRPKKA